MTPVPALHPLTISRLHNFTRRYFQVIRKLNLDASPDTRRRLPELFLTFNAQGTVPLTLHIFPDPELAQWDELHKELRRLADQTLEARVTGVLHSVQERASMYDTLQRTGHSWYPHPAALQAITRLPVRRDAYGLIYGGLLTLHVLAAALLMGVLWPSPDGSAVSELAYGSVFYLVLFALSYLILTLPLRLPPVYTALSRPRQQAFATILADCQVLGRQGIDERLAAELPASVMQRLAQLPATRPVAQDVLLRDEWRLTELWDLAHHAALELTKTPESSPAFGSATRHTEQLLDSVIAAFANRGSQEPGQLQELQEQIEHHARALGVVTPPARPSLHSSDPLSLGERP